VRLNATLSAAAEALTGLGTEFGRSLANGNQILGDLNPRLPVLRHDVFARGGPYLARGNADLIPTTPD
jgi:phospholipid/cholesterol/gamma-HCH transport system substrate-binding protein